MFYSSMPGDHVKRRLEQAAERAAELERERIEQEAAAYLLMPWWERRRKNRQLERDLRQRWQHKRELDQTNLLRANEERLAALEATDVERARSALREVVEDLNIILDSAAEHLKQSDKIRPKVRERIKEIVKRDLAVSTAAALPLGDIADLFDMSHEQIESTLQILRQRGEATPSTRGDALRQIDYLRAQLRIVQKNEDHVMLSKLFEFIVKIAQALAIAVTATMAGTIAVGEEFIYPIVLKTAIIALVTTVLNSSSSVLPHQRRTPNSRVAVRKALEDVGAELKNFIELLDAESEYVHEWPIGRIRLLAKTSKAQRALIEIKWKDKEHCWNILGLLSLHIQSSVIDRARLSSLLHGLRIVQGQIQNI